MHHAAAGDLEPFLAHLADERTAEIDLEARFGVGKVVWPESQLHFLAKQFLEDKLHRALEVANGDVFVDVQPLNLMKSGVVRGVCCVPAINAARHDDAHRRRRLFHHANLNRGSVRAQERPLAGVEEKCVLRVASGVVGRGVERVEAVVFRLNLGAIGHGEADFAEAAHDVLGDL